MAFNLSRFDEPTFISTNDGIAILGSTCDAVFSGHAIGLTNLTVCIPKHAPPGDQSVVSKIYRQRALDYINDGRRTQFVKVVLARIGRDWGLFRPLDMQFINESEGRPRWLTTLGMWWYYPLAALALVGAVLLHRRQRAHLAARGPADHRHRGHGAVLRADPVPGAGRTGDRGAAPRRAITVLTGRATPAPRGDRSPIRPGAAA